MGPHRFEQASRVILSRLPLAWILWWARWCLGGIADSYRKIEEHQCTARIACGSQRPFLHYNGRYNGRLFFTQWTLQWTLNGRLVFVGFRASAGLGHFLNIEMLSQAAEAYSNIKLVIYSVH